jgi:hypothetical protein
LYDEPHRHGWRRVEAWALQLVQQQPQLTTAVLDALANSRTFSGRLSSASPGVASTSNGTLIFRANLARARDRSIAAVSASRPRKLLLPLPAGVRLTDRRALDWAQRPLWPAAPSVARVKAAGSESSSGAAMAAAGFAVAAVTGHKRKPSERGRPKSNRKGRANAQV